MLGLLSNLPRKNCWTIAEWAGEASPHGMQHLLCRASWDADAVRDDVREYVVERLHDEEAVLVVDETGNVKKGVHTVRVQRQYTGTAGRIENSQVAVYLVYAGARGHAAVDRSRGPGPATRTDAGRRGSARTSSSRPSLNWRTMIERFLDAGHCVGRVTGDEIYGGNPKLRSALEENGLGCFLAVVLGLSHHRSRRVPCRHARREGAEACLAEAVGRRGSQGPPLLRLGRHRPGRARPRPPAAPADLPQPPHR
ncbi:transposase [Streptomyces sp. NPDC088246]|uniref:IS701 family transposase n=1 Tax=Streptomyces sp. NPDC088246 TaxID=3365842 RepID=UPI003806B14E